VPDASPGFVGAVVAWSSRLLQKPARLLTRILEKLGQWDIFRRLDKSTLPPEIKAEIKSGCAWQDAAKNDFAESLAECAAIELNRRNIGAQNAHWINLAMSAGELTLAHMSLCERIDKLIIAAATKPPEKKP
jgi:hypothetical protein